MATELRLCALENFEQRLNALETRTIQSIDSSKLDEIHEQRQKILVAQARGIISVMSPADIRFGSKADIGSSSTHVRFTPNSGHQIDAQAWPLGANTRHPAHSASAVV
jgi:seryl-tRNA(Sec) selenium transferase